MNAADTFQKLLAEARENRAATGKAAAKVLADLYVANPEQRDDPRFAGFTEIVDSLLAGAERDVQRYVAERLAGDGSLPEETVNRLARAGADIAAPFLRSGARISPIAIDEAAASLDPELMAAVAGRGDLTAPTIDLLIGCADTGAVNILARNPDADFWPEQIAALIARGDLDTDAAGRFFAALDDSSPLLPELFWSLGAKDRETYLRRIGDHAPSSSRIPFRSARLEPEMGDGMIHFARHRDEDGIVAGLARIGGLPRATIARAYADRGGEALAVVLRPTGLGERVLTALLLLNPNLLGINVDRLRQLARLHERLPEPACRWLAGVWAGREDATVARPETVAEEADDLSAEDRAPARRAMHDPAVARPGAPRRGAAPAPLRETVRERAPARTGTENPG